MNAAFLVMVVGVLLIYGAAAARGQMGSPWVFTYLVTTVVLIHLGISVVASVVIQCLMIVLSIAILLNLKERKGRVLTVENNSGLPDQTVKEDIENLVGLDDDVELKIVRPYIDLRNPVHLKGYADGMRQRELEHDVALLRSAKVRFIVRGVVVVSIFVEQEDLERAAAALGIHFGELGGPSVN